MTYFRPNPRHCRRTMLGAATATEIWRRENFPLFLKKGRLTSIGKCFGFDARYSNERS
jgi:hypothetical protein